MNQIQLSTKNEKFKREIFTSRKATNYIEVKEVGRKKGDNADHNLVIRTPGEKIELFNYKIGVPIRDHASLYRDRTKTGIKIKFDDKNLEKFNHLLFMVKRDLDKDFELQLIETNKRKEYI